MVRIFELFFLSPSSPFPPIAHLSPQLVLTLFISSCCKLQFLHSPPTQAPAQRRQRRLISSFSASISLLSYFSSTPSLNLSPSQTPRPMIVGARFWFCGMIDKTVLLSLLGFMLMGSIFILMNGFWFCWWLMNGVCWWWLGFSGFVVAFG